jgi:endonuclease YncB( thermonuclease family)
MSAGRKQRFAAIVALSILLSFALCSCAAAGARHVSTHAQAILRAGGGYEHARVERVVDGDTLVVSLDDGESNSTRLIGVDAPESVNPDESRNTEEGRECSEHVKALLPEGTEVWLERDVSDTDPYGRWLRYVWLRDPESAGTTFESGTLNAYLVSYGYASAKDYEPDTAHSAELHGLERVEPPGGAAAPGPVES